MFCYLKVRTQKVKLDSSYSSLGNIRIGVPQETVLGPTLFNIFIYTLLLIDVESEIGSFADDNTIFTSFYDLEEVIIKFEDDLCTTLKWFSHGMVAYSEKLQLMFIGTNSYQKLCLTIQTFRSDNRF